MFREILTMLKEPHYNVSEEVEILKGYYEKPTNLKHRIEKLKRKLKLKRHG